MSKEQGLDKQDKPPKQVPLVEKNTQSASPITAGLQGGMGTTALPPSPPGGPTIQRQAARLNDTRFSVSQRQQMANQMTSFGNTTFGQIIQAKRAQENFQQGATPSQEIVQRNNDQTATEQEMGFNFSLDYSDFGPNGEGEVKQNRIGPPSNLAPTGSTVEDAVNGFGIHYPPGFPEVEPRVYINGQLVPLRDTVPEEALEEETEKYDPKGDPINAFVSFIGEGVPPEEVMEKYGELVLPAFRQVTPQGEVHNVIYARLAIYSGAGGGGGVLYDFDTGMLYLMPEGGFGASLRTNFHLGGMSVDALPQKGARIIANVDSGAVAGGIGVNATATLDSETGFSLTGKSYIGDGSTTVGLTGAGNFGSFNSSFNDIVPLGSGVSASGEPLAISGGDTPGVSPSYEIFAQATFVINLNGDDAPTFEAWNAGEWLSEHDIQKTTDDELKKMAKEKDSMFGTPSQQIRDIVNPPAPLNLQSPLPNIIPLSNEIESNSDGEARNLPFNINNPLTGSPLLSPTDLGNLASPDRMLNEVQPLNLLTSPNDNFSPQSEADGKSPLPNNNFLLNPSDEGMFPSRSGPLGGSTSPDNLHNNYRLNPPDEAQNSDEGTFKVENPLPNVIPNLDTTVDLSDIPQEVDFGDDLLNPQLPENFLKD